MKLALAFLVTILVPNIYLTNTNTNYGNGLLNTIFSFQNPSSQPSMTFSQLKNQQSKQAPPKPEPVTISRDDLKQKLEENRQELEEQIGKLTVGIKEANSKTGGGSLASILEELKKAAEAQLKIITDLIKNFDRLTEKQIKNELSLIRNSIFILLLKDGKTMKDKSGKTITKKSPTNGPIERALEKMYDLSESVFATSDDVAKLRKKIKDLADTRKDLTQKYKDLSELIHPDSKITK